MAGFVETRDDKAAAALGEFTKWLTGLATAGLAFTIGLQQGVAGYESGTRSLLLWAWGLYASSIAIGVLMQSAIPRMIRTSGWTIESWWLVVPYWFSVLTLIGGSVAAFLALSSIFQRQIAPDEVVVPNADAAISIVRQRFVPPAVISGVEAVELIKGEDQSAVRDEVWHIRVDVRRPGRANAKPRDYKVDGFVRVVDGWTQYIGH